MVPISIAALFVLYAVLLSCNVEAVAGGADSSGYLNDARIMSGWQVRVKTRQIAALPADRVPNYLYAPLGFKPVNDRPEQIVPIYPPGFPLFVLLAHLLVGWEYAAKTVIVLHAIAGVFLTYLLGRSFALHQGWAAAGAVVLAASPLYILNALQPLSDLPALVWTNAALCLGLNTQRKGWCAIASGCAFGISVLIRPNCILTIVGLLFLIGAPWKRWAMFALGVVPSAAFLMFYNYTAYGSPFLTGYGNATGMFHAEVVPEMFLQFGRWLPLVLTPAILMFPLLVIPGIASGRSVWGLAVCAWTYLIFYSAYVVHGRWSWLDLRFLLPISPALIVGSAYVWQLVVRRAQLGMSGWRPRIALRGSCIWGLGLVLLGIYQLRQCRKIDVLSNLRGEPTYEHACRWINEQLPANSALVCMQLSGAAYYYTPMIVLRYDQLNPSNYRTVFDAADAEGRPIYAVLFGWEQQEALRQRMPGGWLKIEELGDATIWRRLERIEPSTG